MARSYAQIGCERLDQAVADAEPGHMVGRVEAIVEEEMHLVPDSYTLDYLHISSGTTVVPTATIGLRKEGKLLEEAACGNGPVDAICKAVDKITKIQCTMMSWGIRAITSPVRRSSVDESAVR